MKNSKSLKKSRGKPNPLSSNWLATNWGERWIFHSDGRIEITSIPKEAIDPITGRLVGRRSAKNEDVD